MLIIKQHTNVYRPVVSIGVFLFTFLATLFISSSLTPVRNSSAEDVAAVINSSGYFINLTSGNSGVVAIDLNTNASGAIGLAKDTINIKSNAPNGYDLYLSMNNGETDGNRLYKDGSSSSAHYIAPTSGTFSAPAVLDTNSWGYALANTTTGLPAEGANFNEQYNPAIPDNTSLWAGVPLAGNEQLIQTITTPDTTTGINTDIYYGVKANTTLPSGSYKGTITYTAVAKTNSSVSEQTSVSPSTTTKLEGGEVLTIATMLSVDASQAEDPGDPSQGIPAKKVSVTVGGQDCPVTNLSNAQDSSLVITCTAPSMATGRYDVGVDVPKYDKFWVIVNGIEYKYSTTDQDQAIDQVTGGDATAADILLGKTAYVGGTELTGTMPSYTVQYDTSKTATENTADAGLTWSSDGSTLTVAEGYHTRQQVSGRDIQANLLFNWSQGTSLSYTFTQDCRMIIVRVYNGSITVGNKNIRTLFTISTGGNVIKDYLVENIKSGDIIRYSGSGANDGYGVACIH